MASPVLKRLEERAAAAIKRITDGAGCMRVPAEETDPDLVIGDLLKRVEELEVSAGSAATTIRLAQARAEKAEQERDEARAQVAWMKSPAQSCAEARAEGDGGCGACAICCKEWRDKADKLQADLDAALDWIAEGWSNAKPESWARTLALLEKRRADTLRSLRGPGEVGA